LISIIVSGATEFSPQLQHVREKTSDTSRGRADVPTQPVWRCNENLECQANSKRGEFQLRVEVFVTCGTKPPHHYGLIGHYFDISHPKVDSPDA